MADREVTVRPEAGGADLFLFQRLEGQEELGRLYRFRLTLLSERADLVLEDLLGKGMTVTVLLEAGQKRHFHGLVSYASFDGQEGVYGLAAHVDGKLVGIAHYLFHASTWAERVCYLQDLFTAREARGKGVGRALIEAVAAEARSRGAAKYYWLTQDTNAVARALYDKVAKYAGFIRYDYSLEDPARRR